MATQPVSGVAAPKQQRSRESFAKVRAAVLELLQERGSGQFSLAEVSDRSGVSTGSIYARVSGKAELLRAVQAEEFDRLDALTEDALAACSRDSTSFDDAVDRVVRTYGTILRDDRRVLLPFFLLGVDDDAISARGRRSGQLGERAFLSALLAAGSAHGREVLEDQAVWAYELVYSVCVRYLGLGAAPTAGPEHPYRWDELLDRLSSTVLRVVRD